MEEQNSKLLTDFLSKIDQWINCNGVIYGSKFDAEEAQKIISMSKAEFGNLDRNGCIEYIFVLNQYLIHLNTIISKEKAIKNWAEQFFLFVMNDTIKQEEYMSKDKKIYLAIKKSEICKSLNSIKMHSESRILTVEGQISYIENLAKILDRKLYEKQ